MKINNNALAIHAKTFSVVLLPAYGYIMDLADITKNVKTIVTAGIIPFNLLKGALVTFLFFVTIKVYENIPTTIKARFS